jgi:heme/copper-type cytochrome/quinol oxidase subunit 3
MNGRATIDVKGLPDHAFGSRSIMWWMVVCVIAIEATVFIVTIASYFYLQGNEAAWPPPGTRLPGLKWPTINTLILLASLIPNQLTKNAGEKEEMVKVRIWMSVGVVFAVAFVVVRALEFRHLNVSWDSNAYGSITWTLLGFHTFHLVTAGADVHAPRLQGTTFRRRLRELLLLVLRRDLLAADLCGALLGAAPAVMTR